MRSLKLLAFLFSLPLITLAQQIKAEVLPDPAGFLNPALVRPFKPSVLQNAVPVEPVGELDTHRQQVEHSPNNAHAYVGLGLVLWKQNKLDEAVAAFRKAIKLNPNIAPAYVGLGVALRGQKRLDEALVAFNRAIQIDLNNTSAHVGRGNVLLTQGKLQEANAAYRRALLSPDDNSTIPASTHAVAHNNLGYMLQLQGKLTEAIKEFERAVVSDPNYVRAHANLKEARRLLVLQQKDTRLLHRSHAGNLSIGIGEGNEILQNSAQTNAQTKYEFVRQVPESLPTLADEPDLPILRPVVKILTTTYNGVNSGSGWLVKRNGSRAWIVTNRHVVSDEEGTKQPSQKIEVELYSWNPPYLRRRLDAKIVHITTASEPLDLAIVEVEGLPEDVQPLEISSTSVFRNTLIRVIGHPIRGLDWDTQAGEITSIDSEKLQLSKAALVVGYSGGPVVDQQNRVIGIMVQVITPEQAGGKAGYGIAYRVDRIVYQLRRWGVL